MTDTTVIPRRAVESASTPRPTRARAASLREAWVPLAALCLAFFVEMVDNTVLNVALPTIGRDLGAGTTALQWVTGAYSLTFGGLLLTAGSLADRFGRRRVLMAGLTAFGLLSLLVLGVTATAQLVALRAALGIAAAGMAPVTNSLVFRLFDDERLQMRAMTIMVIVGMGGFALGPVLAGTALARVAWQWLLLVNVPIALFAVLGVWLGVPADQPDELHRAPLDLAGSLTTIATMALLSYSFTSGVDHGWASWQTLACLTGAAASATAFWLRERSAAHPMIDLGMLAHPTVRGSVVAQAASSVAMIGAMFGLMLHFQYALGWSPVRAGLGNLPFVVTMLASQPFAEGLARRFGHRVACLVASVLLVAGLVGMACSMGHGYLPVAASMVVLTLGLRTIMTICSVALVRAVPEDRTSMGTALNDTAQELGTSLGVAVVGTVIAAVVGVGLPAGAWDAAFTQLFLHAERITYGVLAVLVGLLAAGGATALTDSREAEEVH